MAATRPSPSAPSGDGSAANTEASHAAPRAPTARTPAGRADPPDLICLRGLRAVGVHGVNPEEQARAQPWEVDIDIELDLSKAGATDGLDDTVDYGGVCVAVERIIIGERHLLLERLAQRIADCVLADPRTDAVTVEIRKVRPPVPVDLDTSGVRITRRAQRATSST